jgi:hypothetical protein
MERYDTDKDGKLDLKEFRYWHWVTNTLDQPSPEQIQERDRLRASIKNIKDVFSSFSKDIQDDLKELPVVAVVPEGKDNLYENLAPAEGRINDGHGSYVLKEGDRGFTRKNPFESVRAAEEFLFPFVEQCLKVIDEYNKRVSGKDKINKRGLDFGWFWASPNRSDFKNTAKYYIYTAMATSKSATHKPGTIYPVAKRRGKNKAVDFAFDSTPPFEDSTIVTPPQTPRKTPVTAKRNSENMFKILMEKYKQDNIGGTEIESLRAEYSRLKAISKEFIQGAEEDLKD